MPTPAPDRWASLPAGTPLTDAEQELVDRMRDNARGALAKLRARWTAAGPS